MNATMTATAVLRWAADPKGTPPLGMLGEFEALAEPSPELAQAARQLARDTAARLGAGVPPFGDPGPIGLGVVLLAAAAGSGEWTVAESLPPAMGRWTDDVARHGLAAPLLASMPETARGEPGQETLLTCSPLTALLHHPPSARIQRGTTGRDVEAAADLLRRPRGVAFLASRLALWVPDAMVLDWRARLLARLAAAFPDFLLEVYSAARARAGAEWDIQLRSAGRALARIGPPDPLSLATVKFWLPLAALDRARPITRERPLMDARTALALVRRYQPVMREVS
jgi:FtsH ternary system-associated peptide